MNLYVTGNSCHAGELVWIDILRVVLNSTLQVVGFSHQLLAGYLNLDLLPHFLPESLITTLKFNFLFKMYVHVTTVSVNYKG